jgi:threonine dehydrogenase-like Zn-dependent dehydrogenase
MRALTVVPGTADSAELTDVPEPAEADGAVLVEGLALGVCGTDREIVDGLFGWPPPGRDRLVLGHESLGRVLEAPAGAGLDPGNLVVGIVRRPDPEPCAACAVGEWDMCRNGRYTERGIKEIDGFCSERWRIEPEFAVRMDPALGDLAVLTEPATILAKAWEHVERIGQRALWRPRRVLVTGAGPIGLLAAMFAVQRGLETHVVDLVREGVKPDLVERLGARYHVGLDDGVPDVDVVVECTGAGELVLEVMRHTSPGGIVCLTGVSPAGRTVEVDAGALNRELVLENDVVFGTVNANRRHYEAAGEALAAADRDWLAALITRRVPLDRWAEALERGDDDVKVVIEIAG